MASSNIQARRPPTLCTVQNFHLVWLDRSIDEINNTDCRNSITKLRQAVNAINTFIDVDECIDFITDTNEVMTSIIVSEEHIQIIVPILQEISQVNSVFIFCGNKTQHEGWVKQWPKVKGVFTDIIPACEALRQAAQNFDHNSIPISFIQKTGGSSNQNMDTLDQSFMYTQILKEILLTIDFKQNHINEFLSYCRTELAGNTFELENVEKFCKEYRHHQPIWWYTYQLFLYSMLNKALRLMEVDRIIKMGFFVRDLHNHIAKLHIEQFNGQNDSNSFTVFRGQGFSQADFDQLKKTQGGLMSFNNFLSTTLDQAVALAFAKSTTDNPDLIGVLFEINIDPAISSSTFANVKTVSYYQTEEEILFSMHSVFRIGQMQQLEGNDRLYQVNLTLTSDNDPQLHTLTKSMQKETSGSTGWDRLGQLMIKLGQFNKAEELYNMLFEKTNSESEKAQLYYQLGTIKSYQGKYAEAAECFESSIKIAQKIPFSTHSYLAASYNNFGWLCENIGDYSEALSFHEKALEIKQKTLPANHSDFTSSYNNIGMVYDKMGEHAKALSYYEKALEIRHKNLPANHPDLVISCNNIGGMYYQMGKHTKALSYYEKALEISQKTLPANHPSLATSYHNIGVVYDKMGEHAKALSFQEKALEIQQKTLPANHPDFASSYNNIGAVHYKMGERAKALSYYEKALEIQRKTLPGNHPDLATSHNNIGFVYHNMGEHSKALSYYEKAFEISQKSLPANHPDLATSHNNIGFVYYNKGDYSTALSYFERALDIWKRSLPPNHPNIKSVQKRIEISKKKL